MQEKIKMKDMVEPQKVNELLRFQIVDTPIALKIKYRITAESCVFDQLTNEYYSVSPINMFYLINCQREMLSPMKL